MSREQDLKIFLSGRRIIVKNVKSMNLFGKFKGLMFSSRDKNSALLFENSAGKGIHSFFVFFPFICIWLDSSNRVVDFRIVRPFMPYVNSSKSFEKIVEIPLNGKYGYLRKNFKHKN